MSDEVLLNLEQIEIESPVDKIITQIRNLIISGQLSPGDRLPPERKLAEKLGLSRTYVRDAIKKLEFYGILKTLPQSGTVVAGIGLAPFQGLVSDVLKLEESEFESLVETRVILETHAASLAAQRRTDEDLALIQQALDAYNKKLKEGFPAVEEDLNFHLTLADASKNSVLKSLMIIITPDIVRNFIKLDVCKDGRLKKAEDEHQIILQAIIDQDSEKAAMAMKEHLKDVLEYSHQIKEVTENKG
jgi:GntR family transcriptional repressor for pyruvate dehydrogenase complex